MIDHDVDGPRAKRGSERDAGEPSLLYHPAHLWRSCMICVLFNEQKELCIKYNIRPPARVIAYGCPEFDECVPF